MTTTGSRTGTAHRWQSAVPCADLGPLAQRSLPLLGDAETAALVKAYADANAALAAAQPEIVAASADVAREYQRAQLAIDELARFVGVGTAQTAREGIVAVNERHADDGPEDRRRTIQWASYALWPMIIFSAVYDTLFLGKILTQVINVGPQDGLIYWLSFLPGVGIGACLLAAGALLALPSLRQRDRRERARTRLRFRPWMGLKRLLFRGSTSGDERAPSELPWPAWTVPVVFTLVLLVMLANWAILRVRLSSSDTGDLDLSVYEPYAAGLVLLLSVAAIALKVISHNPFAQSAVEADKRMKAATTDATTLRTAARTKVAAHAEQFVRLDSAIATAEANARRLVEQGWANVYSAKARRASSNGISVNAAYDSSQDAFDAVGAIPTADEDKVLRVHVDVLCSGRRAARRYPPEDLEMRLSRVNELLDRQFGVPDPRSTEPADDSLVIGDAAKPVPADGQTASGKFDADAVNP